MDPSIEVSLTPGELRALIETRLANISRWIDNEGVYNPEELAVALERVTELAKRLP